MIRHKLPNKTKSATVAEPKLFHQLNNPEGKRQALGRKRHAFQHIDWSSTDYYKQLE
jgi:hypothetical protein